MEIEYYLHDILYYNTVIHRIQNTRHRIICYLGFTAASFFFPPLYFVVRIVPICVHCKTQFTVNIRGKFENDISKYIWITFSITPNKYYDNPYRRWPSPSYYRAIYL